MVCMNPETKEKYIHDIFVWGVLLKGFNGVLEIIGGVTLLFAGKITGIVQTLVQNELIEDPTDSVATTLQHFLSMLSVHTELFAAGYLLSHGVIKIFLTVGLLRNRLWAYPTAIVVFAIFILYQLYRFTFTHSLFLIFLTVFDLVIIVLTWHEYNYFKEKHLFKK